jgi:chromosome segregation ATPase
VTGRLVVLGVAAVLTGCVTVNAPPPPAPSAILRERADRLVERGEHEAAVRAYDEILRRYPEDGEAWRVRATRGVVAAMMAAQGEVARLRREARQGAQDIARVRQDLAARDADIAQMRADLAAREAELARLRQEIATRQAELTRLTSETEQLRLDLEKLKNADMRLERRR